MENFVAGISYLLSLVCFIIYVIKKNKNKKYLLSISNLYIVQYLFILFVIPVFAFSSVAWEKLLGASSEIVSQDYYYYLLESIKLNSFGFLIFTIAMIKIEFNCKKPVWIYKLVAISERYIITDLLKIEIVLLTILYFIIVISTGEIGLLGKHNITASSGIIYYLLFILQVLISMLTLFFGIYVINHRNGLIFFILGLVACILMGKRATLIMDILFGLIIYYLYKKNGANNRKKVLKKALKYIVIMIICAVFMETLRSSSDNMFSLLDNILYGNTFSDIRDGAMILFGFDNNYQKEFIYGKTYVSAILSFIPSSVLDFRYDWDWGRFSTLVLLGPAWDNHPGLRGGWSMEGYINFGIIGIIISLSISAYLYASMERYFYNEMFNNNNMISEKAILVIYILITLARRIICSAGFFAIYVMLIFFLFNIILTMFFRYKRCA